MGDQSFTTYLESTKEALQWDHSSAQYDPDAEKAESYVKNAIQTIDLMKKWNILPGDRLVSLNVVSIFTKV